MAESQTNTKKKQASKAAGKASKGAKKTAPAGVTRALTSKPAGPTRLVGFTGTSLWGGYFSAEYLTDLRGKAAYAVYDEMRRGDAQVKMVISAMMNPIRSARFTFEPSGDSDAHRQAAAFGKWNWMDSPFFSFTRFITEALSHLTMGFSLHEYTHGTYEHRDFGYVHCLGAMAFRQQDSIEKWLVDGRKGLVAVEQIAMGDTVEGGNAVNVRIPIENLCIFVNEQEGDNWEGISILRAAYGAWFRKQHLLKMHMIGAEKSAVGTPLGKYPSAANKEQQNDFESILTDFSVNERSYLMVPNGYEISIHKNDYDAEKLMAALAYEDAQMSRAIVMHFLELGQNGSGGSYSLGADLSDMALSSIQFIGDRLAAKMRELLEPLVEANFGDPDLTPHVACIGINQKAGSELATVVKTYVDAGVLKPDKSLESHIRKAHALPDAQPKETPDVAPEQALSGIQVTSMVAVLDAIGTGRLPKEAGSALLKTAFNLDEASVAAIVGPIKEGSIKPLPSGGPQFSDKDPVSKFNDRPVWTPFRALTKYEQGLNFAEMFDAGNESRDRLASSMRRNLIATADYLRRQLKKRLGAGPKDKIRAIEKIDVNTEDYEASLLKEMAALAGQGSEQASAMLAAKVQGHKFADPYKRQLAFLPPHVKKALESQAKTQAAAHAQKMKDILSHTVAQQVADGLPDNEILSNVEDRLNEFVDSSQVAGAANTISTQALNRGRDATLFNQDNLKQIQAFQFSAILDDATTDICLSLDGKIFKTNDPQADRLTPPLHHGCRSILIPITINEDEPEFTGLDMDPTNPSLVREYERRGKPAPDLAKIKKSRNL